MKLSITLAVFSGLGALSDGREIRGRVAGVLEKRQEALATFPAHTIEQPVTSVVFMPCRLAYEL